MATVKGRGGRQLVHEKRQRQRKSGPKLPPYEDMIKSVFCDRKLEKGFTRDAVLKILLSKYRISDKKTVNLKLNAALRNGVKNGMLKQIGGTGISGTFSLTDTKSEQGPKDSKDKSSKRKRLQVSRVVTKLTTEDAQISKKPVFHTKKSYDLRKKKSTTMIKDIKSFTTRKAANTKSPGGYVKKNVEKQLTTSSDEAAPFKAPEAVTIVSKPTSSTEACSKASVLMFPDMGKTNPILLSIDVPSSKTTPFNVSVTDKTDLNRTLLGMSGPKTAPVNISVTDTSRPKPILFGVPISKAGPFNDSVINKPDLNRTLFGMSGPKTTPIIGSVMGPTNPIPTLFAASFQKPTPFQVSATNKSDQNPTLFGMSSPKNTLINEHVIESKSTSTKLRYENLQPGQTEREETAETGAWPCIGFHTKRSVLIEMEKAVGLYGGGMTVLNDGRKVIADEITLRLYSPDMNQLSLLPFAARNDPKMIMRKTIKDIAIFNETCLIVLLGLSPLIQFVDISTEVMSVTHSLTFTGKYLLKRLTACRGYIFVTAASFPMSSVVQKIDTAGEIVWSASFKREEEEVYNTANCIESFVMDDCIRLVVTGSGRDATITILDGESGDILFVRREQDGIFGLTIDAVNNIYICNFFGWVSVLTGNLSRERTILSTPMLKEKYSDAFAHDLEYSPHRMAFDKKSNSLLITGGPKRDDHSATVEIYQFL